MFLFRGMTCYEETVRQVAEKIRSAMGEFNEFDRCEKWLMSHEEKSARDTFNVDHNLPFASWKPDRNAGIAQVREYLEIRDGEKSSNPLRHPFKPDLWGRPHFYLVVADDQLISPIDDRGLARHRQEFSVYQYDKTTTGVEKAIPKKGFDDAMDSLRGIAADFFVGITPMTAYERAEARVMRERGLELERQNLDHLPVTDRGRSEKSKQYWIEQYMREEERKGRHYLDKADMEISDRDDGLEYEYEEDY